MRDLRQDLRHYIDLRRGLGYKLHKDEPRLTEFIGFLEAQGTDRISTQLAVTWAMGSSKDHRHSCCERLRIIRSFAKYVSSMDARTEIPPTGTMRRPERTFRPYIYTPDEVGRLMAAAQMQALKIWVREQGQDATKILFPSSRGGRLSHDSVQYLVAKHAKFAAGYCATLRDKRVTPHVLRHTTAMELLQAGVDRSVIALWLGHESVETTQIYLDANLALKEDALKKTAPVNTTIGRFKPDDQLLSFLRML